MIFSTSDKSLKLVKFRQPLLVALVYGIVAIALLSPMASASVMPDVLDTLSNVSHTIEARLALEEGQFPLRVAPWQHNGWRYPVFQFYGQFIYTLTGLVYRYITPANPYLACLIVLWLALTVSGFFIYRTSFLLTRSTPAAILAGASYMAAPYFLVNIHARGAFAEAVAQGIVPVVLYSVIRYYLKPSLGYVLLGGVAWFALATTHTITFIYSSIFIGLFVIILGVINRNTWKPVVGIGISYCLGWLLSLYFLLPVILSSTTLRISNGITNSPYNFAWLTSLPTLLQPVSLPPEPQPGIHPLPYPVHIAVGWVMLLGWASVLYYYFLPQSWSAKLQANRRFVAPLIGLFALAFFMTWSPFNFWQFLPRTLWIVQFSYRIMTQVMWTGALLVAYGIVLLFRGRLSGRYVVLGLLLINMVSSSYLSKLPSSSTTIYNLVKEPDLNYASSAYLYGFRNTFLNTQQLEPLQELSSLVYPDGWLKLDSEQEFPVKQGSALVLSIDGKIPLNFFKKPVTLSFIVNDQDVNAVVPKAGRFKLNISFEVPINSKSLRIKFVSDPFIIPQQIDPKSVDTRQLSVRVNSLTLKRIPLKYSLMPVAVTQKLLYRKGFETIGQVVLDVPHVVQLPILYYPDLLNVQVDGKKADYLAVPSGNYLLAALELVPGSHKISVKFRGLSWANWISAIAWLGVTTLLGFILFKKIISLIKSQTRMISKY